MKKQRKIIKNVLRDSHKTQKNGTLLVDGYRDREKSENMRWKLQIMQTENCLYGSKEKKNV
jgi:hypothetical protein